jgi:hypothetical protein
VVTPKNLTTAPINWALLPKDLQAEKENLELYQEFYEEEPSIRENVDKLIKVINTTHKVKGPAKRTPKKRTAKGKAPLAPAKKKPRTPRKTKKAATTRAKAKPRKTKRVTKPKVKVKIVKEKALVNVKKLSLELQLIKSFIAMHGKSRKVVTVRNFLSKIELAKFNTNVSTQKSILTLVAKRMKEGLAKLDKGVDTLQNIKIEQELLQRCKDAIKNAKPRLQVQYLSGVAGKK